MFTDAFPATRNAIRRLEQIRAAQALQPVANGEPGHARHAPAQPDHRGFGAGPKKAPDIVLRLTGLMLPASARIDIAITIGKPDVTAGTAR